MMAVAGPVQGQGLRGRLRVAHRLARHTAWGIGGVADRFYEPADVDDLCRFLGQLPADEPLFWLGLGSNLLVRDGGIRGTVLYLGTGLGRIERAGECGVRAQAGAPCPKVARFCARARLAGAEFLAGIPGTVGGALAMNAGAFGGETYSIVVRVETVTRAGERRERAASEFQTGYRHVVPPAAEWFLGAEFALHADALGAGEARIRELLKRRALTQPIGTRNCGSVFRNPPGDHAARLIEQCGLKGERIGGAEVSRKHANFIINTGAASAADVEALIERVMERVERTHGVVLVPEVRIVGEAA
jgi:UDP-N-acetylmuramate dehydrogenase